MHYNTLMSTVNNEDYYTNNNSINVHIDNIISFRDFLNTVLHEIKSGEYNTLMIKKLSQMVEKFYNEVGDNNDLFKSNINFLTEQTKLTPKLVESYIDSDSDDESDITIVSDTDSANNSYNISKFFSHKNLDHYNDDSDFINEKNSSKTYNTQHEQSVIANYNKLREQSVSKLDYYQSLYEQHKKEFNDNSKNENVNSKNENVNSDSDQNPENNKKPKAGDKLVEDFLNNNLELNNYHYLKNSNLNNINNFCKNCYVY